MKEQLIKQIEAVIAEFENKKLNGLAYSKEDLEHLENIYSYMNTTTLLTKEEEKYYMTELDQIRVYAKPNEKFVENVSPKAIVVPVKLTDKIKNMSKKAKVSAIAVATAAAVTIAVIGISKLNKKGEDNTPVVEASANVKENPSMAAEYKEMADEIVASMNDSISKGLPVTEENKEVMVKKCVEYYMLNNMDKLTDEEWANVFQNSTITAEDIMNSKFDLEWVDEQRVTVCSSDMYLDYSLMFDGADAKLLNDAATLLDKVKTTTGSEQKTAINDFKQYVMDNLGTNNGRMQYSERAMDTFRAIYFDSFDELTNHAVIDDELEHAINTTITCSLNKSDIDVKDATIKSLQSDFEIYETNKLETRLENGFDYAKMHELNKENDINMIVEYVSENIDLSLYKELPNYEETLAARFLTSGSKKSVHDSGVSDGKGGHISSEQFAEYGIDPKAPNAKEQLEQKVKEETEKESEKSKTSTDVNGNKVDPAQANYYTGLGASDYNAGVYNESKVPSQYLASYRHGRDVAKAAIDEAERTTQSTQTYEEVNGTEEVTESTITETTYLNNLETSTSYVPLAESKVSTTSSQLQDLKEIRNYFESLVAEDEETVEYESEIETEDYVEESTKSL